MNRIIMLLANPRGFFSELKGNSDLVLPAIIVLTIAILTGASAYIITSVTVSAMPSEYSQYAAFAGIIAVVAGIIGAFVWWVIVAGVFHSIARLQDGRAGFKLTLAVCGYGHLPQIIGSFISLVFIYLFSSNITIQKIHDLSIYEEEIAGIMNSQYLMAAKIIGIIFLLWSANTWIFGIESIHGFGRKKAIITVSIPVLILVIITMVL